MREPKPVWVIVVKEHSLTRWNVQEQKDLPVTLYHMRQGACLIAHDVVWLCGEARSNSGCFFTMDLEKATYFGSEDEADDFLAKLILETGLAPGDCDVQQVDLSKKGE